MLGGRRSLLYRGRSVMSCDRPIIPIEADVHRQEQLSAGHAVLDNYCALSRLRSDHTSILCLLFQREYSVVKVPITRPLIGDNRSRMHLIIITILLSVAAAHLAHGLSKLFCDNCVARIT